MLFGEGPQIKNIAADLNKLFRQGSLLNQIGQTVEGDSTADQGTSDLLAARDPVIQEISVGMSGEQAARYTVSGTPPLSLPNSLGKPLKAWSVDVLPYQEGTGDPAPDNVRPIHGTDKLTIYTDSKLGRTIDWNQLAFVPSLNKSKTENGVTFVDNRDGTYTVTTDANGATATTDLIIGDMTPGQGHKVLIAGMPSGSSASTYCLRDGWDGINTYVQTIKTITTGSGKMGIQIRIFSGAVLTTPVIFAPQYFDLTQMFGAGNEPTTVAEFRALFPNDYYPYNAGQQMTVDQVNGAQYSPAVITLPSTVYTATIGSDGGESRSGKIVLDGTQTGISVNWRPSATSVGVLFPYSLTNNKLVASGIPNVIADTMPTKTYDDAFSMRFDNGITVVDQSTRWGLCIRLPDPTLTTAALVNQYLAEHPITVVYELATPTTFAVPSVTIPTPTGYATTWATAEDGTVDSMDVTYVGKA